MNIFNIPFIVLILLVCSGTLQAQGSFDSKKKNGSATTTSIKPVSVMGGNSQGRKAATSSVFSLPRNFYQPVLKTSSAARMGQGSVVYAEDTGLPIFIVSSPGQSSGRTSTISDARIASYTYLRELSSMLQLNENQIEQTFSVADIKPDDVKGSHVRLNQLHKGIPIYGHEVIVHLNEYGQGEAFNGHYRLVPNNTRTNRQLDEAMAIGKVKHHLLKHTAVKTLNDMEKKMVANPLPTAVLNFYPDKLITNKYTLIYHVTFYADVLHRWEYFVDANTGNVLNFYESSCYADGGRTATATDLGSVSQTINTYQKGSSYYLLDTSRPMYKTAGSTLPDEPVGGILTVDMKNTFGNNTAVNHVTSSNNSWASATAVSAHVNAGIAYEYFRTKHGRNSIDGKGGTIISIINVADPKDGTAMDNAYWNGKAMYYGNGNTGFKPLAGGVDVAGHEMTHGVVSNSANLVYEGESGAIDESMADIFGAMMDPADWLIGEDVVKLSAFPSGALRSLIDPHNGGTSLSSNGYQPRHMNEKYSGTEDNGGVHINSGIANHAFYKFATAITRDKAASVYYKALTAYLTKSSKFIDLRLAVVKAAGDLYGAGSNEVTQAGLAFDAVGIMNGQAGNYTETLPTNPGEEYLLTYNTDVSNVNTLYRSNLTGGGLQALTKTVFLSKPSVTDDGSVAVFVANDHTIKALNVAPGTSPGEVTISTETIWANVVVSKDGNRIAAVTTAKDTAIYVYDFVSEKWGKFRLYNPTYSEGVSSSGPVYADALEWDNSGEFLVYDAYNLISNNDGEDIDYWDVSFISVWDNAANKFSDGTVAKLFSSLPFGVSIGNPSFSKTSPNIIAFDYIDGSTSEYSIVGCNVETNDLNVIASNNTLGWPSFNKDDKRLAFTSSVSGNEQTKYIMLNSDKISSNGNSILVLNKTRWAVYMANGERVVGGTGGGTPTGIKDDAQKFLALTCYPNPLKDELVIETGDKLMAGGKLEIVNQLGISTITLKLQQKVEKLDLTSLPQGYYTLRYADGKKFGSCKIIK